MFAETNSVSFVVQSVFLMGAVLCRLLVWLVSVLSGIVLQFLGGERERERGGGGSQHTSLVGDTFIMQHLWIVCQYWQIFWSVKVWMFILLTDRPTVKRPSPICDLRGSELHDRSWVWTSHGGERTASWWWNHAWEINFFCFYGEMSWSGLTSFMWKCFYIYSHLSRVPCVFPCLLSFPSILWCNILNIECYSEMFNFFLKGFVLPLFMWLLWRLCF